jgi:GT2 family glycosyltransferase
VVVSILIVNFRAYAELTACLNSLQSSLSNDLEVIVVDHATDSSAANQLRDLFPWIHLIADRANPGFAAGVNRASRDAKGRYLLLLNPDCVVCEGVPEMLAAWLDAHPRVGVCGAEIRELDGSIQFSARRFPSLSAAFAGRTTFLTRVWPTNPWTRRNLVGRDAVEPIQVDWVSGACMMVRRAAFNEIGGMDERFFLYWEDADLCARLASRGWSTVYNPSTRVTHLTGRSSALVQRRALIEFHNSAFRYFRKHAGSVARSASPLVLLGLRLRLAIKLVVLQVGRLGASIREGSRHDRDTPFR